jgi:hypothetical protein
MNSAKGNNETSCCMSNRIQAEKENANISRRSTFPRGGSNALKRYCEMEKNTTDKYDSFKFEIETVDKPSTKQPVPDWRGMDSMKQMKSDIMKSIRQFRSDIPESNDMEAFYENI